MITKQYKISVIIPNYNWEKYLEWCLESILAQNYEDYEIIIIDGKSNDNSHAIIEKYLLISGKIRWLHVSDTGISHAFNLGIQEASGDFLLLLWNDDYLYPGIFRKLDWFLSAIDGYGDVDISSVHLFCDSINYWAPEKKYLKRTPQSDILNKDNLIRFGNMCWFQNIYINKTWFEHYRINEKNKYSMDYESYFAMLEMNQTFIHFPEINSINHLWDNTTCKYWYQSQKEANGIALQNATKPIHFFSIFIRFLTRELLSLIKVKN